MAEERVDIAVENGKTFLEGLFEQGPQGRNAIICHPHPLYGGNMHNDVVQAAQKAFSALGWATLRFNFRTAGTANPAQGEKDGFDLLEISQFMNSRSPGPIAFAGYSYGAWAILDSIRSGLNPDWLVLISPPLDFLSFQGLKPPRAPTLITLGDKDQFCSVKSLAAWLAASPDPHSTVVEILPDVDHFYRGAQRQLARKIKDFPARLS
ncbi:MAG: alpha/beta hydrolase [Syntrophobacteraceae bacterium]